MDLFSSLAVLALAALIHASFQLSIGVLTLMSGHAIGARRSKAKLFRLSAGYTLGAGVMTLLLLSLIVLVFIHLFNGGVPLSAWAVTSGLALGIGIAVWLFYYRHRRKGTELWIPRAFAHHLTERSKATKQSVEAFSLGLVTVLAEILFILPSLAIAALVILHLPVQWHLAAVALYTAISIAGLGIVWALIGSGHSISKIQKWRAANKTFLQFAAGSALIILGFFVYVSQVLATSAGVY